MWCLTLDTFNHSCVLTYLQGCNQTFQKWYIDSRTDRGAMWTRPLLCDSRDRVRAATGRPSEDDVAVDDGRISVLGYDTTSVALVPRLDDGDSLKFPTTLWSILDNKLPDGSWGDAALFPAYDRVTNTLTCVVALIKWSLGHGKCRRGIVNRQTNTRNYSAKVPNGPKSFN